MERSKYYNFGFPHFTLPGQGVGEWCKKHDLKVFTAPCMDCEKPLIANIPFAAKNRRGLRADVCDCGNYDVPFTYVDLEAGDTPNLAWL